MDNANDSSFRPLGSLSVSPEILVADEEIDLNNLVAMSAVGQAIGLAKPAVPARLGTDGISETTHSHVSGLLSHLEQQAVDAQDGSTGIPLRSPDSSLIVQAQNTAAPQQDPALAEQQLIAALGVRNALNLRDSDIMPSQSAEKPKSLERKRTIEPLRRKPKRDESSDQEREQESKSHREDLLEELFERSVEAERSHRTFNT